ncbi:MAG: hypothetical protein WCG34_10920 [Leptolinea sp.]
MKFKYLFLIIGIAILVVVLVSWFAFDWRSIPGGFWTLTGAAAIGVSALVNYLVGTAKDWKGLTASEDKQSDKRSSRKSQKVVDSEGVEQIMKGKGGSMEQTTERSIDVKQHME